MNNIFKKIKQYIINVPKVSKKTQLILVVAFILVALLVTLGIIYKGYIISFLKGEEISDSIKFKREYPFATEDNIFYYASYDEIVKVLTKGTGVILFGFPSCPWCQAYVPILEEVAKEQGVEKIYYYDIKEIRKENTKEYNELVDILKEYLYKDDALNPRIYVPDVYVINSGKIIGHNNDTSTQKGINIAAYYTEPARANIKSDIKKLISQVYVTTCDDEKGC